MFLAFEATHNQEALGSIVCTAQSKNETQIPTDSMATWFIARISLVETDHCSPCCFSVPSAECEPTPLTLKSSGSVPRVPLASLIFGSPLCCPTRLLTKASGEMSPAELKGCAHADTSRQGSQRPVTTEILVASKLSGSVSQSWHTCS